MFSKEEYLWNDDKQDQSEEQEEYAVEKIVDKRYLNGRINYLIKWKGYDDKDNTWEPIDNLFCSDLIEKFEKTYKNTESHNLQQTEMSGMWNQFMNFIISTAQVVLTEMNLSKIL